MAVEKTETWNIPELRKQSYLFRCDKDRNCGDIILANQNTSHENNPAPFLWLFTRKEHALGLSEYLFIYFFFAFVVVVVVFFLYIMHFNISCCPHNLYDLPLDCQEAYSS